MKKPQKGFQISKYYKLSWSIAGISFLLSLAYLFYHSGQVQKQSSRILEFRLFQE